MVYETNLPKNEIELAAGSIILFLGQKKDTMELLKGLKKLKNTGLADLLPALKGEGSPHLFGITSVI
ncbi:MAG: hypothetical protein RXQ93_05925 [Caldisphaera sp.]